MSDPLQADQTYSVPIRDFAPPDQAKIQALSWKWNMEPEKVIAHLVEQKLKTIPMPDGQKNGPKKIGTKNP